ncbi:MAG TPA: prolyl oligopeptidase family serine peptidase [Acidobacteriaceae bacterium]|nr:prolyl oligopeptidase family serine peptidase [Acidobacteriaceae bacterium]
MKQIRSTPILRVATLTLLLCATIFPAYLVFAAKDAAKLPSPPPTKKEPVVDVYHGVKVTDDYRWLEDGQSPAVKQWVAAQNAYTHSYLEPLPQRAALAKYLRTARQKAKPDYRALESSAGRLFALKYDPQKAGPVLVTFDSPENKASERAVVDLNTFLDGKPSQVDWYLSSPDGKLVGLALSTGGSEDGALYVVDAATGKQVGVAVPRVNFATGGGSMAWKLDGSGFYYTRYPQGNERLDADKNFYQQVYFHKLGTAPATDSYVAGKDFPRIAETTLEMSPDGHELLISVANGDGGEFEHFLVRANGQPQQVTHFQDGVVHATFGAKDDLYLLSRKQSDRGTILRLPAGDTNLAEAKPILTPTGKASLVSSGTGFPMSDRSYWAGTDRIYATVVDGGPEEILVFDLDGKPLGRVPLPKVASVGSLVPLGKSGILYSMQTYTQPAAWYRYDGSGQPQETQFRTQSSVQLNDVEALRATAKSKDGTAIPLTILMKSGTRMNGANPTLITGYGGYGISESPRFAGAFARLWIDHGGILVETNLRGGEEYGEAWHRAGMLLNKQNVFDDFAACAEYLIINRYTSSEHLAAEGGSNGGLLMGAEIAQHPEMFRVVLSVVGIYDMLRTELDPNGSFNITEYGSVQDPAQFKALYAYSPYHHVVAGTAYPAVLFVTGDNDHRVNPAHSRKMTAALQAATSSGRPVMLRTSASAGHGFSTNIDEATQEMADIYAFLFAQLGIAMTP